MAAGLFGGGKGTKEDPFKIEDVSDLYQIKNHLTSYFKLVSNINMGEPPFNKDKGWLPITGFSGYVEGNNKRIYNLTIVRNDEDNVAFFSDYTATEKHPSPINNVCFENVGIRGGNCVAAIVAKLTVNADRVGTTTPIFSNVHIDGSIEGKNRVGSFIGEIYSNLSSKKQTVFVTRDCCANVDMGLSDADSTYIGQIIGISCDNWNEDNPTENTYTYYERTIGLSSISSMSKKILKPGNFSYDLNAKDKFKDCFLDTSYWTKSEFNNTDEGIKYVDSSIIKNIDNQTAFVDVMRSDNDKIHMWNTYKNTYPKLSIHVPDYFFVKADGNYYYYDFTINDWVQLKLNKNKKMPSRQQIIDYGIKLLQDIPNKKWAYFKNNFTDVVLFDGLDKTDITFQHNVPEANSTLMLDKENSKKLNNDRKSFMKLKVPTSEVYGVLSSMKGW